MATDGKEDEPKTQRSNAAAATVASVEKSDRLCEIEMETHTDFDFATREASPQRHPERRLNAHRPPLVREAVRAFLRPMSTHYRRRVTGSLRVHAKMFEKVCNRMNVPFLH